ncbi:hypothetical protein LX32DRAFT_91448 [Colletotrichum zoysiae]|uniref:Uncharacterized protein n=1 Tax=Colletotrichum zoysiae TaxID=1216348 RepID=A0AAD9H9G5_9PEZI|nr:hypothetical protein LX32DRAFT_91448 [Colletotrichum zoysiae]
MAPRELDRHHHPALIKRWLSSSLVTAVFPGTYICPSVRPSVRLPTDGQPIDSLPLSRTDQSSLRGQWQASVAGVGGHHQPTHGASATDTKIACERRGAGRGQSDAQDNGRGSCSRTYAQTCTSEPLTTYAEEGWEQQVRASTLPSYLPCDETASRFSGQHQEACLHRQCSKELLSNR